MKPINKAILLVGGKGTRLMPLTTNTPKPMLKIAGVPVTEHQIVKAREAGITEIVLATSYLAEVFEPHFGDGSRFGIEIKYAFETQPLGTGGAIANAAQLLNLASDESFFIFNGDVLSSHDLAAQSKVHLEMSAEVTLHLVEVEDARAYGCVPIDDKGRVLDFLEKMDNPVAKTINAGCYVFNAQVISDIPLGAVTSVERETFPRLLKSGKNLFGYADSGYWIDMGTPDSMIRASRDLVSNFSLSKATPPVSDGVLKIGEVKIDETSHVGQGSYLEKGVVIEENSTVIGSIIGEKAHVESDVLIENSFIAPGSRVISGSKLQGAIFGF
jgi:mannose-1-phosphate guanylyltransferase